MSSSVLITGGSRGIGTATVETFTAAGYEVSFFYKSSHNLAKALARKTGARAFCVDIGIQREVQSAFLDIGPVDVLVNNAGISSCGLFTDLKEDELDALISTNIKGAVFCAQEAAKHMVRAKSGCIINVSSMWGITGASCEVAYSMTKAAIIGLTKALSKELAPSNVRVNCVAPGVIETDMLSDYTKEDLDELCAQTPLGRLGTPEDVAASIKYLASDEAAYVTGQILGVNGGFVI